MCYNAVLPMLQHPLQDTAEETLGEADSAALEWEVYAFPHTRCPQLLPSLLVVRGDMVPESPDRISFLTALGIFSIRHP